MNKSNQFIQNVGVSTFKSHSAFYIVFMHFNQETFEVECVWLIPSDKFQELAYLKKSGENYKSFYRFSANPFTDGNQWSKFRVLKEDLGKELLKIMDSEYAGFYFRQDSSIYFDYLEQLLQTAIK